MRHCRLPVARCVGRRGVLAKLMLVRSSRPLFFPRGSRTVGVRGLPRESRSAWRPRFVDLRTAEKQRREGAIFGAPSKHPAVWPAVLRPVGTKIVIFFPSPDGSRTGPRASSQRRAWQGGVQPASGGGYPTVVRRMKQRRYRSASFLKVEQAITAALRRRSRNCFICKLLANYGRKCDKSCLGCSGPF
jgi:hypothetical protein